MESWKITAASEHWVCFRCRKQFRRPSCWNGVPWELRNKPREVSSSACPECKGPMVEMGRYFRPPRRADKRGWEQMRLLGEHGIRFYTDDAVVYHYRYHPSLRRTKQQIANCSCHSRTEGQRLLRKITLAKERSLRGK